MDNHQENAKACDAKSNCITGLISTYWKISMDWLDDLLFYSKPSGGVIDFEECYMFPESEASEIISKAHMLTSGGIFDVRVECLEVGGPKLSSYYRQFRDSSKTPDIAHGSDNSMINNKHQFQFQFDGGDVFSTNTQSRLPEFEHAKFVMIKGNPYLMIYIVDGKPIENQVNLATCFSEVRRLTSEGVNPKPTYYACP